MYWLYVPAGHRIGLLPLTYIKRAGQDIVMRMKRVGNIYEWRDGSRRVIARYKDEEVGIWWERFHDSDKIIKSQDSLLLIHI